ncbi:MAG: cytochrome c family protein [Planctomycetes bacterium]|nr:cytochrome c family protein [Planctomycetota bacterium]
MNKLLRFARAFAKPEIAWTAAIGSGAIAIAVATAGIPTTLVDFFGKGSAPNEFDEILVDAQLCWFCHGGYPEPAAPHESWSASMMGQAARDPVFWAALAVANQDADFAGDFCLRCHVPNGWLNGRSEPPDGSLLEGSDFDGVSCIVCHRMVDPVYTPGQSPPDDLDTLNVLAFPPTEPGNASIVLDRLDRRRGPLVLDSGFTFHEWRYSPFHTKAEHCGTCHDVSNPVFSKQPNGDYIINPNGYAHPTGNRQDMYPLDRTYSEWTQSDFADGPIDMTGRFGGDNPLVSTCQDCHMPTTTGYAANPILADERTHLPQHFFNGGNTWVLRAVRNLYPDETTYLSAQSVADSINRAKDMLAKAGDMTLSVQNGLLNVRITNQTGHKLPGGYHEGRRMWINVQFLDGQDQIIAERGAYDILTAELTTGDTKVYEAHHGLDAYMAAQTGKPVGESFHHVLNNKIYKDNRIPPRGFTNANFAAINASPVGATYADGQHWDDTSYSLPAGAVKARVNVYYQTTSKEYIEFLRDMNTTNTAGQIAYDQWALTGKSEPALMDTGLINLCVADFNNDSVVDFFDYLDFVAAFSSNAPEADFNSDTVVDFFDYLDFVAAFSSGC